MPCSLCAKDPKGDCGGHTQTVPDGRRERCRGFLADRGILTTSLARGPAQDEWNNQETDALLRFVEAECAKRDRLWCAALLPEGPRVIQAVTTRVNDPAFQEEVAQIPTEDADFDRRLMDDAIDEAIREGSRP